MATLRKTVRVGVVVMLLCANSAFTSCEEIPGGSLIGLGGETAVRVRGDVICPECSLEEVREVRSHDKTSYQLIHGQGRLVGQVA